MMPKTFFDWLGCAMLPLVIVIVVLALGVALR